MTFAADWQAATPPGCAFGAAGYIGETQIVCRGEAEFMLTKNRKGHPC